jgi:nucleotide-binding universal stress UspA family protein
MDESTDMTVRRIVVGVDGSDHARWALVWAMEEAASRHVALDVICAYESQLPVTGFPYALPTGYLHPDALARQAKDLLERELDWAEATTDARPIIVRPTVLEGRPTTVLLHESEGAELLVVGARGLGRIAGMLLGSVSSFCTRHSHVPVVVVPTPR